MKRFSWMIVLTLSTAAFAQSPATDIHVTGEHPMTTIDTPDSAKQLALVDAERKTLLEAGARLQALPEAKALGLKPNQLDAYAAGLVDIQEQSTRTATRAGRAIYQVDVLLHLDASDTLRRLARLRKDQDAARALVEVWQQAQELQRQLSEHTQRLVGVSSGDASRAAREQQLTLTALRVNHLTAQLTAALAKIEERPVGGRAPSPAGRERAKQLAELALAVSPDAPASHYGMGAVLLDAGQPEAAEAEYRKALLGSQDSSSGHTKLANALLLQQRFPEAAVELREALRIDANSVPAHSDLGWVLRAQQNIPDAISEYQEALRLDPDFVDAHNGLAVTLASQGRVAEAVAEFREIVRIDPDSAVGHYNLSYALADIDKDEESAAALREVIRINPDHYNARYNLGELFRLEGKFDDAARQFREYVRLAPDDTPRNRRNIERAKAFIKSFENP
jgi:tetratricopeptide (TPR) repeat protein